MSAIRPLQLGLHTTDGRPAHRMKDATRMPPPPSDGA